MDSLISDDLFERLKTLSEFLSDKIQGQDEVLKDVVALLRRSFCLLRLLGRPIASMLFLGPTGVGKTETAILFTQHLFSSEDKLVRFDMSEYMTADSIGILRGENENQRGLFGHYYDRSQGSGTLLFDEIEKAHPLIMDLFLQILGAGRFTTANGETLDLSNYVVVATANIGSRMLMESRSTDRETLVRRSLRAATQEMRPETYARFDLHCVFNKLDYLTLSRIGGICSRRCVELINAQGHKIECQPGVIEHVQREGYSEHFGARPMQNAAMRILGDVVMEEMMGNGGRPVVGGVCFDRRANKCFFQPVGALA